MDHVGWFVICVDREFYEAIRMYFQVLTVMVFFGVYHLMALRFNLSMAMGEDCGGMMMDSGLG